MLKEIIVVLIGILVGGLVFGVVIPSNKIVNILFGSLIGGELGLGIWYLYLRFFVVI